MTASPTNFSTVPPWRSRIDAQILEVAAHPRAQRLRIGRLAERRRADEVAEEDGDDLALLARERGAGGELGAAHPAQAETFRILLTAARTDDHAKRLRRRARMDPMARCGDRAPLAAPPRRDHTRIGAVACATQVSHDRPTCVWRSSRQAWLAY